MKKTISVYWPLALIVPLAAIAWLNALHTPAGQAPLAAERLTAELARAVSYGLVGSDADAAPPLKAMPAAAAAEPPSRAI